MVKNFKLDLIIYSENGAVGFYNPLSINQFAPYVAFVHKGNIPVKLLREFNAKNSIYIIENTDFINGFLKTDIVELLCPDYMKEISHMYAKMKYSNELQNTQITFKNIPEIISTKFLSKLVKTYMGYFTDKKIKEENKPVIFELATLLASRNDAEGTFLLAMCYFEGLGTKKSKNEFFKYLKKSSDLGYPEAKKMGKDIDKLLLLFDKKNR